jgi:hypothetical protein
MALCQERMFRYDLALDLYDRYLREAGPRAQGRASALAAVELLHRLLVTLDIEVNVSAEVWVSSRLVGHAPGRIHVPAGQLVVELRAPLHESVRQEVALSAGESRLLRFSLTRLARDNRLSPACFWVSAGLTAVALGTGIAAGVAAVASHASAEDRRLQSPYLNTRVDEAAIRHASVVADVSFITAGLFAVGSVILYFVTDFRTAPDGPDLAVAIAPGFVEIRAVRAF